MSYCPKCKRRDYLSKGPYHSDCGTKLIDYTPKSGSCGTEVEPYQKFCPFCGKPVRSFVERHTGDIIVFVCAFLWFVYMMKLIVGG